MMFQISLHRMMRSAMTHSMNEIEKKIRDRQTRLDQIKLQMASLEKEMIVAEAQIHAYQDARDYYASIGQKPDARSSGRSEPDAARTARALTGQWLLTMRGVGHLETFGVDDVLSAAEVRGHVPTKDNIRSQIFNYKNRGIVEAIEPGLYRFTEAGRDALQLNAPDSEVEDAQAHDSSAQNDKAPH